MVPPSKLKKKKRKRHHDHDFQEDSSSSTEIGGSNGNDTESEQEDIPKDQESVVLTSSQSTLELKQEKLKRKLSEPDLLRMEDEDKNFFEELLEEFDKNSLEEEKPANNDNRALQIIQENSEILEKILKSDRKASKNNPMANNITLQSNPATKPITFNPFPNSARANRKPKEVGRKLGLYK